MIAKLLKYRSAVFMMMAKYPLRPFNQKYSRAPQLPPRRISLRQVKSKRLREANRGKVLLSTLPKAAPNIIGTAADT